VLPHLAGVATDKSALVVGIVVAADAAYLPIVFFLFSFSFRLLRCLGWL